MKRNKYSAGAVKFSFWFMEFRKEVQLLAQGKTFEEIKKQLQPEVAADCEIMILKDCPECIQAAFDSSKYDDYSDEYIVVSLTLDKELGNLLSSLYLYMKKDNKKDEDW